MAHQTLQRSPADRISGIRNCAMCVSSLQTKFGAAFVLVYVDDLLVLAPTVDDRKSIVGEIKAIYEVPLSDGAGMFLVVQLRWINDSDIQLNTLEMSQRACAESMLRRFGLQYSKTSCTPMVESFSTGLSSEKGKSAVLVEKYHQMIGYMLFLAPRSRLNILAPVLILTRFQKRPTDYCHCAVKRVLRYLRGTTTHALRYTSWTMLLDVYVDAGYAGDIVDRKSMSGFVIKLGNASVLWGSRKKSSVALSTCKS